MGVLDDKALILKRNRKHRPISKGQKQSRSINCIEKVPRIYQTNYFLRTFNMISLFKSLKIFYQMISVESIHMIKAIAL